LWADILPENYGGVKEAAKVEIKSVVVWTKSEVFFEDSNLGLS